MGTNHPIRHTLNDGSPTESAARRSQLAHHQLASRLENDVAFFATKRDPLERPSLARLGDRSHCCFFFVFFVRGSFNVAKGLQRHPKNGGRQFFWATSNLVSEFKRETYIEEKTPHAEM